MYVQAVIKTATQPLIGEDVFSLVLPTTTGRVFCDLQVSVTSCMGCYPTTVGKDFLLILYWLTPNKAKMLSLKMGLPSLRVVFRQVRYFLVRDSCHQQYS